MTETNTDEQTDGLHAQIFAHIRKVWDDAHRLVDTINLRDRDRVEKAPESFLVGEYGNAIREDWLRVAEPLLRKWLFDGTDFIEQEIVSNSNSTSIEGQQLERMSCSRAGASRRTYTRTCSACLIVKVKLEDSYPFVP